MKRIFITGGAGFIGSHIAESLISKGHKVTIYDNFDSGSPENIRSFKDKVKVIRGDIMDYSKLLRAMKGHDVISHQAAQLEILRCIDDPLVDLRSNTVGTLNVLKAAAKNKIKRLINASSACVYGQAESLPQGEGHPKNPNWPYGVSKLAAEKYCRIFQDYYGICVTSLRYGIVYGPREWFGRVLTYFIKRALEKKPLIVFDRKVTRDFIFVDDVVRFHNLCLTKSSTGGQVFNVATGKGTDLYGLAKKVKEVTGLKDRIIFDSPQEGRPSKYMPERKRLPAELKKMVLDTGKAKKLTGWNPQVDLAEGIRREFLWLKANRRRWSSKGRIRV
ncbi:NAD-dependent epimerase/dehydratase family protein [Candidatus Omnitrophota bacterium]